MNNVFAVRIASIFGLCHGSKMPGTLASLASLVFSFAVYYFFPSKVLYLILLLVFLFLGLSSIKKVQKGMGVADHQWIGIDEWVGMWIANLFLFEAHLGLLQAAVFSLISFALFRAIDITKKIPPIQNVNDPGKAQTPAMVMLDDIIGGFYTCLLMLLVTGYLSAELVVISVLVMLPAMAANAAPTLFSKIKHLSKPINEKIFGRNKTWRGLVIAVLAGILVYFAMVKLELLAPPAIGENYAFRIILMGFLLGFGAIGGDLVKSFFKRKAGVGPGESFPPWDQIDHVLGMVILTFPVYFYSLPQIMLMLVLGGFISATAHRLGYAIKLNTAKQ